MGDNRLKRGIRRRSRGQAVVEYILLLAVIVPLAGGIMRMIQSSFDRSVPKLGARMESTLKSGRTPRHVWAEPELPR